MKRAIAAVTASVFALAACTSGTTITAAPKPIDPAKALYYLQAAGCVAATLSAAAAPVIQATADAEGNTMLTAAGASALALCKVVVPAAAVAPAAAGTMTLS